MEITLRCNAKCQSCSRHCPYGFYDEASDVTIEQVGRFIEEVKCHGNIDMVSIMGGEPTVHPQFREITELLRDELLRTHAIRRLQVVSNGIIPIDGALGVGVDLSAPEKAARHRCQLVAPFDTGQKLKECPVPYDCGVSFGAYGWWPCGAGGAICRLFNLSQYRRDAIPRDADDFPDRQIMHSLCQAKAEKYMMVADYGDIKSRSFRKAIREFEVERLERY
ncbi:MAG: radical SAM protein [Planctomycetota bacterium]